MDKNQFTNWQLPRYEEIPDVGLYLEQACKYINGCIEDLPLAPITGSMISNYVKKGLVDRSIKKCYYRDQLAYILFIAIAKHNLSMDQLDQLIKMQKPLYEAKRAYIYFVQEFEIALAYVFHQRVAIDALPSDAAKEQVLLRNLILACAYQIFLEASFQDVS